MDLEISSEVLDFNSIFALLCAATIKSSIGVISDMNIQIATATEEQSSVIAELNMNITRINDISLDNQHKSVKIGETSEQIQQGSSELNGLVSNFKV